MTFNYLHAFPVVWRSYGETSIPSLFVLATHGETSTPSLFVWATRYQMIIGLIPNPAVWHIFKKNLISPGFPTLVAPDGRPKNQNLN